MMVAAVAVGFTACEPKGNDPDDPFKPSGDGNGDGKDTTVVVGERDGSEAKPYIVQDLLDMKKNGTLPAKDSYKNPETKKEGWVEAYIVGSYNYDNDPKFVIGAANASSTSLLLADAADCTDTYAVASVKLQSGTVYQAQLNLVENAGVCGKKVKLHGCIEAYCGIGGVVAVDKAYLDGAEIKAKISESDFDLANALKPSQAASDSYVNKEITVVGFVTSDYKISQGQQTAWLADEAGAEKGVFEAYYCNVVDEVAKGAKVAVKGKVQKFEKAGNDPVYEIKNGIMMAIK